MTKKEYFEFHQDFCNKMTSVTKAKNADYTGTGDDPFANFRKVDALTNGAVSVEAGFLTRMSDKFSRIGSFMQKGTFEVKDEGIHDTLLDLANYCALMAGYLKERNSKGSPEPMEDDDKILFRDPFGQKITQKQAYCKHYNVAAEKDALYGNCVVCGLTLRMTNR